MDFYIENKVIRFDKKTLDGKKVVGDNTDYLARFFFDDEWEGKLKTARFINNEEYVDVILDENDSCYAPIEVMKSGNMNVGVYAGNLTTTTSVKVKITASILEEDGLPADPTPDVYSQIVGMIDKNKGTITPRGLYNEKTNYEKLDVVRHEGCSYIVKQDVVGVTPSDNEYYMLLAEKGTSFSYNDLTEEQINEIVSLVDVSNKADLVDGKVPLEQIPDNVGGVQPDWDETDDNSKAYIKNKPFGDFTAHIKWDGNTSGLEKITIESPYASAVTLYKVYNGTLSEEELNGGTIIINGQEKKLGTDVMVIPRNDFIISNPTSLNMMKYIVALNDCQFSSQNPNLSKPYMTKGVYFAEGVTEIRPSKPNIKQIDPKFIPEIENKADLIGGKVPEEQLPKIVNSWNELKDRPFEECTPIIKWNGDTSGLDKIVLQNVTMGKSVTLYKVSNETFSREDLVGGTITIGGYVETLGDNIMVISYEDFITDSIMSVSTVSYMVVLNDCQLVFPDGGMTSATTYVTAGTYFAEGVTEMRTLKPSVKQIDPKFIPELDYAEKTELQNINNELLKKADLEVVNEKLLSKSDTGHNHDDIYYRKQTIDNLLSNVELSDYAEIEYVNSELSKKAEKEHKHDVSEINGLLNVETGFKIEWDGNPTDEYVDLAVEGNVIATLYKVGDAKTKDELNGSTVKILWSDNRETEFTLTYEHMRDLDNGIAFMIQGINDYDGLFYFISPTACVDVMEEVAVLNFPSAGIWAMSNEDYRPISIINDTYVIKTLNENIIPNSIARTTDLNNKADLVDGVVPKSQLPNDIGVQADWNETDESSPSYIHNKTHGIVGAGLGYTLNDDGTYIPVDAEKDCEFLSGSRLAKFVYVSDKLYTVDELLGRTIKTKNLYLGDDTRVYDEYRDIEITADLVTQVADGWTIIDADSEMPIISVITESIAGADVGYGFSLPSNVGTYLVHLDKNPNNQDGYVFGSYKVDIGEEVKTLDPMFLPSVTEMKDFTKEVTQVVNTSLEQAKASGELEGEKGDKGDKGDKGEKGEKGDTGANGADGYTPVKGVDYFTDEEKAEMVAELSQIEVPTIVSSVDEMTDTSKHYVLEGYIYSSQKVVTQGGTTSPNMFTPTEDCLNMRLSGSTGSTSSNPGSFITDFIPVTNIANETQFIVRLNREVVDYKENKLVYYNTSKTRLGTSLLEVGTNTTISNGETVTDIKTLSTSSSAAPSSWSDVAYIRIQYCLHLSNNISMSDIENCEVTFDVNNVVTEETVKYQWVNSGISYAPTFRTDLIGVVGEDNVIYLSENLPSGTYTLKYGDETYETIGTITVM